MKMKTPGKLKEVQKLTGSLTALNRFIAKATDKCHPFFKVTRKGKRFEWSEECELAFQRLKTYISSPGDIKSSSQFSIGKEWWAGNTTPSLLYEQGTDKRWEEVHKNGEASICTSNCHTETQTILLGSSGRSNHRFSADAKSCKSQMQPGEWWNGPWKWANIMQDRNRERRSRGKC